ncbi:MAG: phosphate ABC transporter ATP-binding protein [bacterium]
MVASGEPIGYNRPVMRERVRVTGLSKTKLFPGKDGKLCPKKVLDKVDMTVREGEIFVILGPTGSGKSTLLRMLNRLEVPDSGKIFLDGKDTEQYDILDVRRKIGMVFQSPVLFDGRVEEDILFGQRLRGTADRALAGQLAKLVGLPNHLLDRTTRELSAGEKQKVAIARALANQPEILLMDEPTSALDPSSRLHIEEFIKKARNAGPTVILVTHDVEQAKRLADRLLLLIEGERVTEGSKAEIFGIDASEITKKFLSGNLEVTQQ